MKKLYTIYEFGTAFEIFSKFLPALLLIITFLVGLLIFLNAKYLIDPDDRRPTRRGGLIHFEAIRTGRIMMILTGVIIPVMAVGLGYSYSHEYTAYYKKQYKIVEGAVKNLKDTLPCVRHCSTIIQFSVDTVQFAIDMGNSGYSPIWESHKLNDTAYVRISYIPTGQYNGEIVKFESN